MPDQHTFEIRRLVERSEELAGGGDLDGARAALRDALKLAPDNVELLCALGRLDLERGDLPAARAGYERSLAIDGRNLQARYELAFLRIEERRYDEAETLIAGLVQELPESVEALSELGYLYRITGRLRRAMETLRRALEVTHDAPDVLLSYAVTLCEWGDTDEAREQLERAREGLRDSPDTEAMRAVDRLLAELDLRESGGLKRELYLRHGVVLLGTAADDGVEVPPYFFYHLEADEAAVTLGRFVALARGLSWSPLAIAAVDPDGAPAAQALSEALRVPVVDAAAAIAAAPPGGRVVLVEAVGDGEGAERAWAAKAFEDRGLVPITFTIVLVAGVDALAGCPDVVGVVVPAEGSVPWARQDAADGAATDVGQRLAEALPEDNAPEQVRFYAAQNRRLRAHLRAPRGPVLDLAPLLLTLPPREDAVAGLLSGDPPRIAGALSRLERAESLGDDEVAALLHLYAARPAARVRADRLLSQHAPERHARCLMDTARTPRAADDRREAVARLLSLGRPEVVEFLVECLREGDDDLRYWVVGPGGWGALERLENDSRFPDLVRRCLAAGGRAAVATIAWLRLRGDARFVEEGRALLRHRDEDLAVQALAYLSGVDAPIPWRALWGFLRHEDDDVVRAACRALDAHWSALPGARLPALVRTAGPAVAGEALAALLRHRPRRGVASLVRRLRRSADREDMVGALADAVGRSGGPRAARALAAWAPEQIHDDEVGTALLAALATAGDHGVLPAVRALLSRAAEPPVVAFDYIEAYGDADDERILLPLLGGGTAIQCRAAAALCRIGRPEHLEVLRDALDSRNPDRFRAGCEAAGRVDGPAASRLILDRLDRQDGMEGLLATFETWVVRRTLKGRLAAMDPGARGQIGDFLRRAFETGLPDQRRRALDMMEAVGPEHGSPALEGWLTAETDAELLQAALEHAIQRPSPGRAAAARRLVDDGRPEVAALARTVVSHWQGACALLSGDVAG